MTHSVVGRDSFKTSHRYVQSPRAAAVMPVCVRQMTHSGVSLDSGVKSGRCCGHACVGERHDSLESET